MDIYSILRGSKYSIVTAVNYTVFALKVTEWRLMFTNKKGEKNKTAEEGPYISRPCMNSHFYTIYQYINHYIIHLNLYNGSNISYINNL